MLTSFYFAPMEGVTTCHFRRLHAEIFPGVTRYYAPFMTACQLCGFRDHEMNDLMPENNEGVPLVPQLLGNDAPSFLVALRQFRDLGYEEVNLNLGCPSGTVVSKFRGSGFLSVPEELDRFLEEVFRDSPVRVSIKTRLGLESPEEFEHLLEIYRKYPISELIVHARVGKAMYRGHSDPALFAPAAENSPFPVCYNGDLFTRSDVEAFAERYPDVSSVMLGRGAVANPGLISSLAGNGPMTKEQFREFHDRLYEVYCGTLYGDRAILHRMKELWSYFAVLFPDGGKILKDLRKSRYCCDYESAVNRLFREASFDPEAGYSPV